MPVSENRSQKVALKEKRELTVSPSRQPARKAPGTRMGTWQDWREGSSRSGKIMVRHGHAIRDGR